MLRSFERAPLRMEKFPQELNRAGKRLFYRLLCKFGLDEIDIASVAQSFDKGWNTFNNMTVEQFLSHYFSFNEVIISADQLKELLATWDYAQKDKIRRMTSSYIKKEMDIKPVPVTSNDAMTISRDDWYRGYRLGAQLYECLQWLILYALKNNKNIVCYGRDGEILYDAIMWLKRAMKIHVPVKYIVCSRNQLTILERMSHVPVCERKAGKNACYSFVYEDDDHIVRHVQVKWSDYEAFLGNLIDTINLKSIHVDTGYKGSIPKGIVQLFARVTRDDAWRVHRPDIRMLSSNFEEYSFGENSYEKTKMHVDSIVSYIEHKDQNLRRTYHLNMKPNRRAYKYHCFRIGVIDKMRELRGGSHVAEDDLNF